MTRHFRPTREQLIPSGYSEILRDDEHGVLVVASPDRTGVMAFGGKSDKPAFYTRFRTVDRASQYVKSWHEGILNKAKAKRAERDARKNFVNPLVLGQILSSTWGYDQTNVNFYQVVRMVGRQSVEIREIGYVEHTTASMEGLKVPAPNNFCGTPMVRRVAEHGRIKIDHAYATPVEFTEVAGVRLYKPQRYSTYA